MLKELGNTNFLPNSLSFYTLLYAPKQSVRCSLTMQHIIPPSLHRCVRFLTRSLALVTAHSTLELSLVSLIAQFGLRELCQFITSDDLAPFFFTSYYSISLVNVVGYPNSVVCTESILLSPSNVLMKNRRKKITQWWRRYLTGVVWLVNAQTVSQFPFKRLVRLCFVQLFLFSL